MHNLPIACEVCAMGGFPAVITAILSGITAVGMFGRLIWCRIRSRK